MNFLIADSTEPSTLMGQFMEALNSQTNLDDLNLNIDSFQGGLECNVDEVSGTHIHFIYQCVHCAIDLPYPCPMSVYDIIECALHLSVTSNYISLSIPYISINYQFLNHQYFKHLFIFFFPFSPTPHAKNR